jgi:hypothetical protein
MFAFVTEICLDMWVLNVGAFKLNLLFLLFKDNYKKVVTVVISF